VKGKKKGGNEINDAWEIINYVMDVVRWSMIIESSMKKAFYFKIDLVNNLRSYKYRENSTKILKKNS
jgi:hypothetical protein